MNGDPIEKFDILVRWWENRKDIFVQAGTRDEKWTKPSSLMLGRPYMLKTENKENK